MKTIKNLTCEYWNNRADDYNKIRKQDWDVWKAHLSNILGCVKNQNILDIGTGPGTLSIPLAQLGANVTAVDLSPNMLEKVRDNAIANSISITHSQCDAENLPFKDNSFDVVINKWLFWALPNPEDALSEWKRVLKPNGTLIIIDGNWFAFRNSILKKLYYHLIAMPLVLITERKNRWGAYSHLEDKLPMISKNRPESDIEMLSKYGFETELLDVNIPITSNFIESLKSGHQGKQFIVKGINTH